MLVTVPVMTSARTGQCRPGSRDAGTPEVRDGELPSSQLLFAGVRIWVEKVQGTVLAPKSLTQGTGILRAGAELALFLACTGLIGGDRFACVESRLLGHLRQLIRVRDRSEV